MQKVLEAFNSESIRRFNAGDPTAFEDVFILLFEDGVEWANACLFNKYPISARTITAEVLFIAFNNHKLEDFKDLGQIKYFLVTTIRDTCKSFYIARTQRGLLADHEINHLYYRSMPDELLRRILQMVK